MDRITVWSSFNSSYHYECLQAWWHTNFEGEASIHASIRTSNRAVHRLRKFTINEKTFLLVYCPGHISSLDFDHPNIPLPLDCGWLDRNVACSYSLTDYVHGDIHILDTGEDDVAYCMFLLRIVVLGDGE